MFTLPETRFDFGGDEYIYAEISRDMSEESNFKALAITNELRRRQIPGILDICPSNAYYLVRFDPEVISANDLLEYLKEINITKSNPSHRRYSHLVRRPADQRIRASVSRAQFYPGGDQQF
ncbi:carboxyltransferase domain-containing protein [Brevibacillus massiliensis]|uniref:carboxyltransferase domain-containing protein n=1 Tax=Brevibacillus massiliensis TaxID=1118054 RepID=UPI0002DD0C31